LGSQVDSGFSDGSPITIGNRICAWPRFFRRNRSTQSTLHLRNDELWSSEKCNDVRIDSEADHAVRPSLAASIVNGHDELTQRERLSLRNGFHGVSMKRGAAQVL